MSQFMVGRQPIFDAKFGVRGYELLFRDPSSSRPSGDRMTADVLVRAGLDVGLSTLVGTKLAFVNATRSFLVGEHEVPFSPSQAVIEILEDVPRDAEVLRGCRGLVSKGYTLALDDYVWRDGDDPLLELASIVKLDVLALTHAELANAVRQCATYGAEPLAEKVETREQLAVCQDLGFDLFQGYLLSRPEVVDGQALSPSRATCLRVLEKLCDPTTSFGEVESIVRTDAALSYRFLRAAGAGAARGLYRSLSSVRDAVVMLGERRLRAWVTLMLLSGGHEGSDEQFNIAMTRARMAELMALAVEPRLVDQAFTVGLVSALDLLLQVPLQTVVDGLSLSSEPEEALLGHTGVLGDILVDVLSWEVGGGDLEMRSRLGAADMEQCYMQALAWSTDVCGVLDFTN